MSLPVIKATLPTDLNGVKNGQLPAELLRQVVTPGISSGGQAHSLATRAWNALVLVALQETGNTITVSGNPYRTFEQQKGLFVSRYDPVSYAVYLLTAPSKKKYWPEALEYGYTSKYWRLKPGMAMAGVPGTSNHGLGLAFDTALFVGGKIVGITSNAWLWAWLSAPGLVTGVWAVGTGTNVESFGFSWETQSEPWHIRLVTGDYLSRRVRDIEAFLGITP